MSSRAVSHSSASRKYFTYSVHAPSMRAYSRHNNNNKKNMRHSNRCISLLAHLRPYDAPSSYTALYFHATSATATPRGMFSPKGECACLPVCVCVRVGVAMLSSRLTAHLSPQSQPEFDLHQFHSCMNCGLSMRIFCEMSPQAGTA